MKFTVNIIAFSSSDDQIYWFLGIHTCRLIALGDEKEKSCNFIYRDAFEVDYGSIEECD